MHTEPTHTSQVARARAALVGRVRGHDDRDAAALLATLDDLADARPTSQALQRFATGCLLACFERADDGATTFDPDPPHPSLATRVAEHARALETAAAYQDDIDARHTAIAWRAAAEAFRGAATGLGAG